MPNMKDVMTGSLAIIVAAGSIGTVSSLSPQESNTQAYQVASVSEKYNLTGELSEALDEKRVSQRLIPSIEVGAVNSLEMDKSTFTSKPKPAPKPQPKPAPKPEPKKKVEPIKTVEESKTSNINQNNTKKTEKVTKNTNSVKKQNSTSNNKPANTNKPVKEPTLLDIPDTGDRPSGKTPSSAQNLAKIILKERGINDSNEFNCLNSLWTKESTWNYKAANPVSTARGIPQALMSAHFGSNWRGNSAGIKFLSSPEVQIKWGLDYIKGSYGKPCAAWAHSQQKNWY